ncbi:hypothetical protein [Gilvibacter sp.]|uniref:hypothetical protein n=1 Tax=Gilvibacter sp. TaxID=2729997 RepID=UPI003F49CA7C
MTDITGFYLYMTTGTGEYLTLPNNLVLQKGIELLPEYPEENADNQEDAAFFK